MPKLIWNAVGSRYFETGLDRGVLYLDGQPGIPWNGLTSVSESPSGGDADPLYLDGVKYLNLSTVEEFEATLTAYTYPVEFSNCDGTARARAGLFLGQQRRSPFGLCYRSRVGNDLEGADHGYKIHLIYNALVSPSERHFGTTGENSDALDFSWKITTKPIAFPGYKPTSHLVLDSRYIDPVTLGLIEDKLYGSDSVNSHLPSFSELLAQLDDPLNFSLTDNGDGSFTIDAPTSVMTSDDTAGLFRLTWPTAYNNGNGTFTISN
jgi:hypothetical protein